MPTNRHLIVVSLLVFSAVFVFHVVYRYPSPALVAFVSRVTGNALGDLPKPGAPPPALDPPPATSAFADDGSSAVAATETTKPRHNFRSQRFNAKLHMVNQLQLFMDYPVAYWLTVDVDIASWPWMSANLISLIHPVFGVIAGYCIFKARHGNTAKESSSGTERGHMRTLSSTAPAFERAALVSHTPSPHANGPGGNSAPGAAAVSPMNDTIAGTPAYDPATNTPQTRSRSLAAGALGTPSLGPSSAADFEMREPAASKDFAASLNGPGAAAADAADGSGATHDELGNAVRQAGGKDLFASANASLLRWAAVFFWIRNFLDTLDGVVARVQRHRAGIVVSTTSFGFNGHVLDMVTDTAGVTFINVAIFVFLCSNPTPLA